MTLLNHLQGGEHIVNIDPHFERADKYQKRAWLSITPANMIALCQDLEVSTTAGCSVELRIYQQKASILDSFEVRLHNDRANSNPNSVGNLSVT